MPELLYEEVIEVEERVVLHQDKCLIRKQSPKVKTSTGEQVCAHSYLKFTHNFSELDLVNYYNFN